MSERSRVAATSFWIAAGSAGLAVIGIVAIHVGAASPFLGFRLFGAGAVLGGLLTLVLSIAGLVTTRGGRDPAGRGRAWIALGIGVVLWGAIAVGGSPGAGLPAINDITTNLDDPPAFTAALNEPANAGRDMSYPPDWVPLVREAYPDLDTIALGVAPPDAFRRSIAAAESLGWEITFRDAGAGVFEARDTTAIFQFVDDIRVRIRPAARGSAIDVRSKSRDGRGDVGANAARIRRFEGALRS